MTFFCFTDLKKNKNKLTKINSADDLLLTDRFQSQNKPFFTPDFFSFFSPPCHVKIMALERKISFRLMKSGVGGETVITL